MIQTQAASTKRSHQTAITAQQTREGPVALAIEKQTAQLPSDVFLWGAGAAIATSLVCELLGAHEKSRFVGQWVAPILICGVYNKIVKTHGSDQLQSQSRSTTDLAGGLWRAQADHGGGGRADDHH